VEEPASPPSLKHNLAMPKSVPGPSSAPPTIPSAQELVNKVLSPLSLDSDLDYNAKKFALSATRVLFSTIRESMDIILDVVDKKMAALEDEDEPEVEPRTSVGSKGSKGKGKERE